MIINSRQYGKLQTHICFVCVIQTTGKTRCMGIYGLLYHLQSAFCILHSEDHNIETALIKVTDQILFNLDCGEVTGLVFVDFKKAFDIVDHQLLLKKLKLYRTGDVALT